jgi:hypothetical protein
LNATMLLHDVGAQCAARGNAFETCLEKLLAAAITLTAADKGNIQLADPSSGTLRIAVQRGFKEPFLKFFEDVESHDSSCCGAALGAASRVVVKDVSQSAILRASQRSKYFWMPASVRSNRRR